MTAAQDDKASPSSQADGPATAILADIGGTNARFALFDGARISPVTRLAVDDFKDPTAAIVEYLARATPSRPPRRAAFAIAGPVSGDRVSLTNSHWSFDAPDLARDLRLDSVLLLNDFEAIAWGVPRLGASDVRRIGAGNARPGEAVAVIGPGTGLGVAGFLPGRLDGERVLVTEGGHVSLPAGDDQEAEIIAWLRRRYGHVSAERVLCGDGLVNLYEALAAIAGRSIPPRNAAAITDDALSGSCAHCLATLDAFCTFLGGIAGNLALTLGARGGVYVAGGIVPRFADYFAASRFREQFLAKGRFRGYLEEIPTLLIQHPHPAFLGLANCLDHE